MRSRFVACALAVASSACGSSGPGSAGLTSGVSQSSASQAGSSGSGQGAGSSASQAGSSGSGQGAGSSASQAGSSGSGQGAGSSASGTNPSASGSSSGAPPAGEAGAPATYTGQYNLGPVDWQESQWHNACAPYPATVQSEEGNLLAGLNTQHIDGGRLCDACILVQAGDGKSVVARVVTYGDTGPNDIDVSPAVCTALAGTADCNVWPRMMTWQFTKCTGTGSVQYQFQTAANIWWTSLWVRNQKVALAKVEVKSQNHPTFTALSWGTDGTLTDAQGFGAGPFSIRLTATDGQQLTDTFPSFNAGDLLTSTGQFQ